MTSLTTTDAREIRNYLTSARVDILQWLPGPEWNPAWKSEAASELGNSEMRRDGSPWGELPVLWTYATAWLFISAGIDCLDAMCVCITTDTPAFVPNALTRIALEAGAKASWLLHPGIGARRRVARRTLIHDASARQIRSIVDNVNRQSKPHPKWRVADYPPTIRTVADHAADLLLCCEDEELPTCDGKAKKQFTCEGESLPTTTRLASTFAAKIHAPDGYTIWSNAVHAGWHAITSDWYPHDPFTHPRATHRESIWAAAINARACVMDPCHDALTLLGHNARLAQWRHSHIQSRRLIQRMNLPADWTSSRNR